MALNLKGVVLIPPLTEEAEVSPPPSESRELKKSTKQPQSVPTKSPAATRENAQQQPDDMSALTRRISALEADLQRLTEDNSSKQAEVAAAENLTWFELHPKETTEISIAVILLSVLFAFLFN